MGLFGKSTSPELQSMLDSLARSYMRGHRLEDPTKRAEFVDEIAAVAGQLKAGGKAKAVSGTMSYRPAFFTGLPPAAQQDFVFSFGHAFPRP